jgi:hypothetical protein
MSETNIRTNGSNGDHHSAALAQRNGNLHNYQVEINNVRQELDEERQSLKQTTDAVRQAEAWYNEQTLKMRKLEQENKSLLANLTQAKEENARLVELIKAIPTVTAPQSSDTDSASSVLRKVMATPTSTSEEMSKAIAGVQALVDEAKHELKRVEYNERRAAYEEIASAINTTDEGRILAAIGNAQITGVGQEDIAKAEEKLQELTSMTAEEKEQMEKAKLAKQRKNDIFVAVRQDQGEKLEELIEYFESEGIKLQDLKDISGRTLLKCAQLFRAKSCEEILVARLPKPAARPPTASWNFGGASAASPASGSSSREAASANTPVAAAALDGRSTRQTATLNSQAAGIGSTNAERDNREMTATASSSTASRQQASQQQGANSAVEANLSIVPIAAGERVYPELTEQELRDLEAKAKRGAAQNDMALITEVLQKVRKETWSTWANKAGDSLVKVAHDRQNTEVYSALARELGLLRELDRDFFAEDEDVWVYKPGEACPLRAKVLEDTPVENDEILIQYLDGDDAHTHVARATVRKIHNAYS